MQEHVVLKDVSFSYGSNLILSDFNLSITKGTIHTLIGKSGAGKSLTLKLISGLSPVFSGEITNLALKTNFAFQLSPLIPWLTVIENLKICTDNQVELMELINELSMTDLLAKYPSELSGGMLQRVNVLRSFLGSPDLILMDEPFVHVDSIQKEELHEFLLNLWERKKPTILFVTHDIDEALYLSQKISLYSKARKSIVQTIEVPSSGKRSILELKNSPDYLRLYPLIYNHLKEDQA